VINGSRYVCQRKRALAARSLTDTVGGRTNLASCLFGSHLSTDALFCELAHDTFVADQGPADQAGPTTVAGEAGRNELKRRLEAGIFRLVQVFNNDQAFLAVREGHFAVLAFRGTEGKELLETDLNFRLVLTRSIGSDGALWLS
jgi:hypothetical protein